MKIIFIKSGDSFSKELKDKLLKVKEMLNDSVSLISTPGKRDALLISEISNFLTSSWISERVDCKESALLVDGTGEYDEEYLAKILEEILIKYKNCIVAIINPLLMDAFIKFILRKWNIPLDRIDKHPAEINYGDIFKITGDELRYFS